MLTSNEYNTLTSLSGLSLIDTINSNKYISSFYHYVLDTSSSVFSFKGYDIENPQVSNINFRIFNSSSQIGINTSNISIDKVDTGYRVTINSNLKLYRSDVSVNNISCLFSLSTSDGGLFYLKLIFTQLSKITQCIQ